jgi:Protein of unknown function DUF262/Protein of unknown function (DUF1524)
MPSNLYTSPVSLRDIFADAYQFSVPAYQRPFSWRTEEAEQLFEDLLAALYNDLDGDGGEPYFFGTLLMVARAGTQWKSNAVLQEGAPDAPRDLDIVDGQQRMVTLTILIAVLRDLALEAAESAKTKKLADEATAAVATLDAFVTQAGGGALLDRARVAISERHRPLFETCVRAPGGCWLDGPGGALSPAERGMLDVRNYFLSMCGKLSIEERQRLARFLTTKCLFVMIIARNIDQGHRIFTVLNDRGMDLEIQDIVKAEVIASFRTAGPAAVTEAERIWDEAASQIMDGSDYKERKTKRFTEFFSHIRTIYGHSRGQVINGIRALMDEMGGQRFLTEVVQPYAAITHQIINANHAGSLQSAQINRLLTYLGWQRSADWMPSTMLWMKLHRNDPTQILAFLREMDRFAYSLRLQCLATNKRTAKQINDNPDREPSTLSFGFSDKEQRHVASNLGRLHERNNQICKLLLLRINDEIAGGLQNVDADKYSVEHILPKNPPADSEWLQLFTSEQRERFVQALGNLTLVTRPQNERASNLNFAEKQAIYFEAKGPAALPITQELAGLKEWGPAEVAARANLMLARVREIWQLPLVEGLLDEVEDQ